MAKWPCFLCLLVKKKKYKERKSIKDWEFFSPGRFSQPLKLIQKLEEVRTLGDITVLNRIVSCYAVLLTLLKYDHSRLSLQKLMTVLHSSKSIPVRACVLTSIDYFFSGMNLASLIFRANNQKVRQKSWKI